jgi:RNA polymerase sporulation-specific sigma factor
MWSSFIEAGARLCPPVLPGRRRQRDLIQEGMVGLIKAIREFDSAKQPLSKLRRDLLPKQLFSAIKTAAREKHSPMNNYVFL